MCLLLSSSSSWKETEYEHWTHRLPLSAGRCGAAGFNTQVESRYESIDRLLVGMKQQNPALFSNGRCVYFLVGVWFFQKGKRDIC